MSRESARKSPQTIVAQRNRTILWQALVVALLAGMSGCKEQLDTWYGRRAGPFGGESVNGAAVLGDMFADAGHRVVSRHSLTPSLFATDAIVWCPNSYEPPSDEVMWWFHEWLAEDHSRTLIYVGRDFDAAPIYWQTVLPLAPKSEKARFQSELRSAQAEAKSGRPTGGPLRECDWFAIDYTLPRAKATQLDGPWATEVDATKADIRVGAKLTPSQQVLDEDPDFSVLLSADGAPFVTEHFPSPYTSSRLILIENGSFLLNLPLVNHEHRKLAGQLVADIGPPEQKVVFLESGPDDPPIFEDDPDPTYPTLMEKASVWPICGIVLHLGALGVLFAVSRWPIFGVPRESPAHGMSDFGRHVSALGRLLQLTRDREFAEKSVRGYCQREGDKPIEEPQNDSETPPPTSETTDPN